MKTKKVFGYIFLVLAILLSLAVLAIIPRILKTVFGLIKILSGTLDSYDIGYFLGGFTVQLIFVGIVVLLWILSIKWIKKTK